MTVSKGGQAFGIERDGDIHLAALDPLVDAVGAVLNHLDLNIGILHGEIGDQVTEKQAPNSGERPRVNLPELFLLVVFISSSVS